MAKKLLATSFLLLFIFTLFTSIDFAFPRQAGARARTVGDTFLPDWQPVTIKENKDFIIVDNADGIVVRFRKDSAGYNEIWVNESIVVNDERWILESYSSQGKGQWKQVGIPTYVSWSQPDKGHVIVERHYDDYLGTTFKVRYDFYGGYRPKISFEGEIGQTDEYRIQWQISGVAKSNIADELGNRRVKFWNDGEEPVVFDYTDVYESFGDITTLEIEPWANNHKLNQIFNVGKLPVGSFTLDPNFGYETVGTAGGISIEDTIVGSIFTITEGGIAKNITAALYASASDTWTVKCAIYLYSDFSFVGNTSERSLSLNTTATWYTFNMTSDAALSDDTEYILVAWGNDVSGKTAYLAYDPGDITQERREVETYGTWPDPLDPSIGNREFSIYVTYEATTGPVNNLCEATANFEIDTYGWVNQTVTDVDGVADLKTVDIQIYTGGDAETFTLRWTQATDTFSEVSDTSGICTLDVSTSTRENVDSDTDKIAFYFKLTGGTPGACDVKATSTDDQDETDVDMYGAKFNYVESGDFDYTFYGLYDEETLELGVGGVNVTAYFVGENPETFEVNGTEAKEFTVMPSYFHFELGTNDRQYWLPSGESSGEIWVFNQSLTSYTITFIDLAGILDTYPNIAASRSINGTLYTVEKRRVDEENKVQMSLINGAKYTITVRDSTAYYTWGELLMTDDTTVTLTLRAIQFPKETLLTYKNVRIYGLREYDYPNGSISITYEDLLLLTTKVDIYIYDENDTGVYNTTLTSQSFVHTWNQASNTTSYKVTCYIYHQRYGTREWKQYFYRSHSTAPWGAGFLGESLPFATSAVIPAFIILFVAGCFSVINAQLGAFMAVVVAGALTILGWISITPGALITAFALAVFMAITYAKRRITY